MNTVWQYLGKARNWLFGLIFATSLVFVGSSIVHAQESCINDASNPGIKLYCEGEVQMIEIDAASPDITFDVAMPLGYEKDGDYMVCRDVNIIDNSEPTATHTPRPGPGCNAANNLGYPIDLVPEFAARYPKAVIAINADFFGRDPNGLEHAKHGPQGLTIVNGWRIDGGPDRYGVDDGGHVGDDDGNSYRAPSVIIKGDGSSIDISERTILGIQLLTQSLNQSTGLLEAFGGCPMLVENGVALVTSDTFTEEFKMKISVCNSIDPTHLRARNAIGVTDDGRLLILVVPESPGLTIAEVALLMKDKGAKNAMNLDGGGSTQLWYAHKYSAGQSIFSSTRRVANALVISHAQYPEIKWCPAQVSAANAQDNPCIPTDTQTPSIGNFTVSLNGEVATMNTSEVIDLGGSGVARVNFSAKWSGTWHGIGSDTSEPYTLQWNTCSSSVPDGIVEFGVEVIDGAGNKYVWSQYHNNPTATKNFNCNPGGDSNPGGSAKLYALSNYGGATVWSGNTGFTNAPNGDSYSFELPNGWSARSWRGDNRTGEERCWTGSVSNLQDHGWHLAIQSTEVFDHNVCRTNTSGDAVTMCADSGCWNFVVGYYSLPYWEMNDILTKITNVPSNLSVMLYREGGLRGTVECFNSPRDPLPSGGAYDLWKQVTDVLVFNGKNCPMTQQGAVVFYDEPNFGNYYWAAGNKPGIVNMADLGPRDLTNDKAQSMRIPPSKSAVVSEHDGGQGQSSSCQTGDVPNLGSLGNQVSSVRIFDNTNCAPDAPTSLSVTGLTYHSVTLSWSHTESASLRFKVYKWDGYNFVEFATTEQGMTSFTREDAQCNMTEYYKVAALRSDGRESKQIGWVAATTESCPLPAEPQFVYFDKFTYEGETIFWWYNTPFAQDYNITAFGDIGEEYTSGWQTGTLWYAKDLRPDRVYLIKLIARNEAGQNENGLNFVWVKLAPPDITDQTAKCDSVNLTWQNKSGYARGFKVYRDEQIVAELGAEAVSYVDTGVAASSSYVYKVEVVGEHAFAASSSQLEYVSTPACNQPQQPVAPQLVSPAQSAQFSVGQPITFQWLGGVADRYQLYVNRLTGGESRTIDLTETSYTIADLPPGSYQWFVSSITEAGQVGSSMGLFSVTENQTAFQLYLPLVQR